MVNLLIFTIKTQSPELAFHSAVSLGRLCVVEPVSKTYLITRLPELSPCDKGEVSLFSADKTKCLKTKMIVRIQNVPLAMENLEVSTGHPKKVFFVELMVN